MRNFEDVVIFVTDMEQAIDRMEIYEQKLLAMSVLEEYTIPEVAHLLGSTQRTVERSLQEAIDGLSRILLADGLMDLLPISHNSEKSCQGGKNCNCAVSGSNKVGNKCYKVGGRPSSDLIS